jgi:hypothetical protein
MPDRTTPVEVYQLRARICEISPMIWRRLLVRSDNTLADLHYALQIAFDWTDFHLHQFTIHGRIFGVGRACVNLGEPASKAALREFQFRVRERFLYIYDFGDFWQHEIRIEKKLPLDEAKTYPICIGGAWAGPPEDCGGPWAYMQLRQHYSPWHIADAIGAILDEEGPGPLQEFRERFPQALYWLSAHEFDRQEVNRRLAQYAAGDEWRRDIIIM